MWILQKRRHKSENPQLARFLLHYQSGTLLYKPDVKRSCCPHYTIRLLAAEFKATRDQRQAQNRWNRFVLGDAYMSEAKKRYRKSKEEKARDRNEFILGDAVHEAEYSNLKTPPEPAHKFEVTLDRDTFTEEKFELYSNYQQAVHHDAPEDISRKSFQRFLCDSSLQRQSVDGNDLGSFHQCYRLDGRLIAMAVLDLLPHAVSGVYFIYHSDFEKYSFGKISALREASLAKELGLQYYYMGFYIHSCKKMRYKGDYRPQFVLDPETYQWNPLEGELRELLNKKKYVSLARERRNQPVDGDTPMRETSDDEDDGFQHVEPQKAMAVVAGGMSVLELGVPGVLSARELTEQVKLDEMKLMIPQANLVVQTQDLVMWEQGSVTDPHSIKGAFAELAAAVGPEVAREMVIKLNG
ncbi:arginine-tRNA-protein transferase [Phyllosticta capitalensis]|uniref:Arginyl-tRNA--protein transferase 1 n=1 Tax=Phyllosticta capitalensis TaxID=121624 RepID=A0ABR1Z571_9PEZI